MISVLKQVTNKAGSWWEDKYHDMVCRELCTKCYESFSGVLLKEGSGAIFSSISRNVEVWHLQGYARVTVYSPGFEGSKGDRLGSSFIYANKPELDPFINWGTTKGFFKLKCDIIHSNITHTQIASATPDKNSPIPPLYASPRKIFPRQLKTIWCQGSQNSSMSTGQCRTCEALKDPWAGLSLPLLEGLPCSLQSWGARGLKNLPSFNQSNLLWFAKYRGKKGNWVLK